MPYLIGIDEAGYGPNLGPLVVAAAVWRLPHRKRPRSLYDHFKNEVTNIPTAADSRLVVADSKLVYRTTNGLARLELGVTSFAQLCQSPSALARWRTIWPAFLGDVNADCSAAIGYQQYDRELPLQADPELVKQLANRLGDRCDKNGVRLVAMLAAFVGPADFNQAVAKDGGKANLLSRTSLGLARRALDLIDDDGPVTITFDKHGGRNHYAALLSEFLADGLVGTLRESSACSSYQFQSAGYEVEADFQTRAESNFATALASMTAKYLRELAMLAFNDFWLRHVPGLRPTAGYPVDARRFWNEIAEARSTLGIADDVLWRRV